MIRQILVMEEYVDTQGTIRVRSNPQLSYGHNDDPAFKDDDGKVVTAIASPTNQSVRVVMDELLVGNYLEMIQCRGHVSPTPGLAQNYSKVPVGATPDDLAKCSGAQDVIFQRCVGDRAVCINNTGVEQITDQGGVVVPPGMPVGIEDAVPAPDGDGVPDKDLFIEGSVRIMCKGVGPNLVEAPIDITKSYWQPSGNQQVPAHGGVSALGPALVLNLTKGLPTGTLCHIAFDPSVTDKEGNIVCAPPDGDVGQDCPAVGDTTLATFGVAALRLDKGGNVPEMDGEVLGTTNALTVQFNTLMDLPSLQARITLTKGGTAYPFTVVEEAGANFLRYDLVTTGTQPGTKLDTGSYTLTINPDVTDFAGQPFGKTVTKNFTVQ